MTNVVKNKEDIMKYKVKPEVKQQKGSKALAFAFAAITTFSGAMLSACDSKAPQLSKARQS